MQLIHQMCPSLLFYCFYECAFNGAFHPCVLSRCPLSAAENRETSLFILEDRTALYPILYKFNWLFGQQKAPFMWKPPLVWLKERRNVKTLRQETWWKNKVATSLKTFVLTIKSPKLCKHGIYWFQQFVNDGIKTDLNGYISVMVSIRLVWFTFKAYVVAHRGPVVTRFTHLTWRDFERLTLQECPTHPTRPESRPATENNG